MGLYTRDDTPYWWMYLEPTGERRSTKKLVHAGIYSKRNKQLAEAMYHEAMTKLGERATPAIAFKVYAKWYLENRTPLKRGFEREKITIARFVASFGSMPLTDVDRPKVYEWIAARLKGRPKPSVATVNREIDVLKQILASAVPKYLPASPLLMMPRLRAQRGEAPRPTAVLTIAQENKLLAVLEPPDKALVLVALCTLFRLGDVLDLRWADVHGTWIEALDTKTGAHVKVPLAKRAREALNELKPPANAIYLFTARREGTPAKRRNRIKLMLKYACQRAKIPYGRKKGGITFHSLRHTGATRMLAAGVDPRTVQEIGGWANLSQVMRYTHPTESAKRRAVEQI